jgi:hypothetical protein
MLQNPKYIYWVKDDLYAVVNEDLKYELRRLLAYPFGESEGVLDSYLDVCRLRDD